jgi:hypothetical protein
MDKKNDIAGKTYDPSDYQSSSLAESGIAMTHEQATDTLTEGTVDQSLQNKQK